MTVTFFLPILFLLFYVQVTWLSRFRPWEQKTWRTFLSFLVKKAIFWVSFCIKISFDYISSEKYIFYFHNIHSVNVHNHSLARCCEDFSDLARIMWNCNVLVAMDAAIGGWMDGWFRSVWRIKPSPTICVASEVDLLINTLIHGSGRN